MLAISCSVSEATSESEEADEMRDLKDVAFPIERVSSG
jgi:hypothetical protein